MRSVEFTVKLFCTYDKDILRSCMSFFRLPTVKELVDQRKSKLELC